MKTLVNILSFLLPITTFCQLPNSEFENWSIINSIEEPDNWGTNNETGSISVSKTNDSYGGNFALQVINNGPSFEGPLPGYATVLFTNNNIVNKISAYVKCDSISGTGKGIISVHGYLSSVKQEIGYWETSVLLPQYTLIEIPINPVGNYDSIEIRIESFAEMDLLGWPTGYARLKVDQLTEEITSDIKELSFNKSLKIFPNPCHEELNINYLEGVLTEFLVFDINGKLLFQKNIDNSSIKINVKHYQKGLYFIRTIDHKGLIKTYKVIIE